jgi:diguanylate cyclase (GGDEF)-like protein/PAS domain S-box-containing protein
MNTATSNPKTPPRWPVFVGLVAAGLLGNYFKFALFLNIDLLFGSIFAMLALQLFGLVRGVLAAALIASYTFVLWNHPYAIVIMAVEVAVVGTLMSQRKMSMLLADTLYWLVLGMPLVFVFYALVMKLPMSSIEIIMVKQAVNGVANALLARLLFASFSHRAGSGQLPLHELVGNLLTAFLLFPALLMLAVGSRADFAELDLQIRSALQQKSLSITNHLTDWVQDRTRVVLSLSELAATLTPRQMQGRLEQAHAADTNFLRIGLRDTESVIVAYAPPLDESGQSNIGKKFPERPYIAELKKNLQPMLAEVVMGRIDKSEPVVVLLAPVLRHGYYAGYVNTVLRLNALRNYLHSHIEADSLLYSLLDSKGNVILSNRTDQKMMMPFVRGKGALQDVDANPKRWLPVLPPNTSIADQWKNSYYVVQTRVGDLGGWQLVLEQPVAPFQKILYDNYTEKLTLLVAILMATLALAEILSRRITATLDRLGAITHDLPGKLATGGQALVWPHSKVAQTQQLVDNFRVMADSLVQQFRDIRHFNESLETRVLERTQQLAQSESRFRLFVEHNSSVMLFVDPKSGTIEDANSAALAFYGYSKAQLMAMHISEINTLTPEQTRAEMQLALRSKRNYFLFQHRLVDGTLRDVEVYSTPIETGDRTVLFSIVHDITERRLAELERDANRRELVDAQLAALNLMEDAVAARDRAMAARVDLDALLREQKAILNNSLVGIVTVKERKIIWANLCYEVMLGYAPGELDGAPTRQSYVSEEDYRRFGDGAYAALGQGLVYRSRLRLLRKDGQHLWAEASGVMLNPATGESLWCFNDITQQVQAEANLQASELHLKAIVENEPECIKVVDAQGLLLQMNPAGLAMVEADSEDQVVGQPVLGVIAPEHRAAFAAMHQRVIAGESMQLEFEVQGLKGGRRWLETHAVPMQEHGHTVHLAVTRDITVRKQMQDQVRQLAFYDSLTTLANRRLFNDRLDQALLAGKRAGGYCALLFLDLDNFKPLNDTYGHEAGDLLLVEAAARMKACVRAVDTVARFGGDEFVVLLSELAPDRTTSTAEAAMVAEKIHSALGQPYQLRLPGHGDAAPQTAVHHCTASIGVAIIDAGQVTAEEAMRRADKAMYDAKAHGRDQVWFSETV